MDTTRTSSPYFSPNSAIAPVFPRILERHQPCLDRCVLKYDRVRQFFGTADLAGAHRLRMGEIEPQAIGSDGRTLLRDVLAEHAPQSFVHQMGRRVVGTRRRSAAMIHDEFDGIANLEAGALERAGMNEEIAQLLGRIGHPENGAFRALDQTVIAELAARLAVEWASGSRRSKPNLRASTFSLPCRL